MTAGSESRDKNETRDRHSVSFRACMAGRTGLEPAGPGDKSPES